MKYILSRVVSDDYLFIEESKYPEWIYKHYQAGLVIDTPFEFFLYKTDPERIKGDIIGGINPFTIVSDKFKAIFEICPGLNVNFYPVTLVNKISQKTERVWLFQVLTVLDAFDWERSDYKAMLWDDDKEDFILPKKEEIIKSDEIKEKISLKKIFKLKLKENSSANIQLFRLKKRLSLIVIDDFVANKINEAGLTGIKLIPVDEYSEL